MWLYLRGWTLALKGVWWFKRSGGFAVCEPGLIIIAGYMLGSLRNNGKSKNRHGFTKSKTTENTRWKKHKKRKWSNYVKTDKQRGKSWRGMINLQCDRQLDNNWLLAEWSFSPWVYWSMLGLPAPDSSDWRWICLVKHLWMTAEISGLCSGSSPSPGWCLLGG